MHDLEKRQAIGDRLVIGSGYEVGAGLSPSRYRGVKDLICLDIRDKRGLQELFRSAITYEVYPVDSATGLADFVVAHHVIEHAADPIRTLGKWVSLIKDG